MCAALGLSLAALAPLAAPTPAQAGSWQFTASGNMTITSSGTTPPSYTVPTQTTGSYSLPSCQLDCWTPSRLPAGTTVCTEKFSLPLTISVAWVPDPKLASDPAPSVVRLVESSNVSYVSSGTAGGPSSFSGNADDGFGDAPVLSNSNYASSGSQTKQYSVVNNSVAPWTRTLTATATATFSAPAGGGGSMGSLKADLNSYSIQVQPITAALKVDQDQQVFAPAATTRLSATLINTSGFTVDSVNISVDGGTPITATVTPGNPNNWFINWPQTGGNPSEHSVKATAVIHDAIGSVTLDSTRPEGNGRPADDIIADVRLQSLKFNGNIKLTQDATTPVPTPEFTWTSASNSPATSNPAAYIQGSSVNLTMLLGSSTGAALTGGATMGYALKLQATPNTTNPATSQADPALTLYDNTAGSPFLPTPCGSSVTIAAPTALNGWVAEYTTSFSALNLYVEFTQLPTPVWRQIGSYPGSGGTFGNALYASLAGPSAPMSTPWVSVLDYACNWAARTTDAPTATALLTTGFYFASHYNGGTGGFVDNLTDTGETFHLKSFLTTSPPLSGQCNDFSDFLVCASNALGALGLLSQRSTSVAHIQDNSAGFTTNPITDAPQFAPYVGSPTQFGFHQWTNYNTIFDGAIRFGGVTAAVNMTGPAPGTTYYNSLVDTTKPNLYWSPITFLPTAAN